MQNRMGAIGLGAIYPVFLQLKQEAIDWQPANNEMIEKLKWGLNDYNINKYD